MNNAVLLGRRLLRPMVETPRHRFGDALTEGRRRVVAQDGSGLADVSNIARDLPLARRLNVNLWRNAHALTDMVCQRQQCIALAVGEVDGVVGLLAAGNQLDAA